MCKRMILVAAYLLLPFSVLADQSVHVSLSNIHMEQLYGYTTFNTVAVVDIDHLTVFEDQANVEKPFGIIDITDGTGSLPVIVSNDLLQQLPNMVNSIENSSPVTLVIILKSVEPQQRYSNENTERTQRDYTLTEWLVSVLEQQSSEVDDIDAYIENIERSYEAFDLVNDGGQTANSHHNVAFELVSFQNTGDIGNCADRFSRCEDLAGYALPDHKTHLVEWCLNDADRPFEKLKRFQNEIPGWDDIKSTKVARLRNCASIKDSCERLTGDRHLGYSEDEFVGWCLQ